MTINNQPADETDLFLLNPDYISFIKSNQGQIRSISFGTSIVIEVALALSLLIGIAFAASTLQSRSIQSLLDVSGIQTSAKVTYKWTTPRNKGGVDLHINYRFSVISNSGVTQTYDHEEIVSYELYNLVNTSTSTIEIEYLKDDPGISRIYSSRYSEAWLNLRLLVSFVLLIIPIICALYLYRQYSRNRRLEQRGQIILGTLVDLKSDWDNKYFRVTVMYKFSPGPGTEKTGTQSRVRNDLHKTARPQPGVPIAVLYVDDGLFQML